MNIEKLVNQELYTKMYQEYTEFLATISKLTPEKILDSAYEKVFKEELLTSLETKPLPYGQAVALLRSEYPLDQCYHAWLKSDASYEPDLRYCIEKCGTVLERERRVLAALLAR